MKHAYFFLLALTALMFSIAAMAFSKKPAAPASTPAPTSFATITAIGTWGNVSPAPVAVPIIQNPNGGGVVSLEKTCPAVGAYQAVDASEPVTQKFLFAMRALGVKTVIRYYDQVDETLRGKTPKLEELKLLAANGMNVLGVFQHNNRWKNERTGALYHTFDGNYAAQRGPADAKRALELAKLWHQPMGSAIYFGVDFDADAAQMKQVLIYATNFAKVARAAGFKVGVYGSGDTLKQLKSAGLVDFTWVSQSTGFSGTKAYTASNAWNLLQAMPKDCGGINVDFDKVNGVDFGQWKVTL